MKKIAITTVPEFAPGFRMQAMGLRARQRLRGNLLQGGGRLLGRGTISGPDQVVRSLHRGLEALGFDVCRDPAVIAAGTNLIFAPSNLVALHAALAAKADGRVCCVVAGPNICMHPDDLCLGTAAALPDFYLMPSEWARRRWLGLAPKFPCPVVLAVAGVDPMRWRPAPIVMERRTVILYDKIGDPSLRRDCEAMVAQAGGTCAYLRYGKFTQPSYQQLLREARAMIYLSHSESQGIALFEAWASDVPTLVYDPSRQGIEGVSPAPYLSGRTGAFFQAIPELAGLLVQAQPGGPWRPREWIMENGTDEAAASALLRAIGVDGNGESPQGKGR